MVLLYLGNCRNVRSLARLEMVEGDTVHLAGVDILDNTPVLDIKPYIPQPLGPGQHCHELFKLSNRKVKRVRFCIHTW